MTARSFAILFAGCLLFAAGIAYHRTATVSPTTSAPVATATATLVPAPWPTPLRLLIAGSPTTRTPRPAYILADPTPRPALPPRERTP